MSDHCPHGHYIGASCDRCLIEDKKMSGEIAEKYTEDLEAENVALKAQVNELLEAIEYFCDRVDEGSIHSKTTYAKYKAILAKYGDNP